MLNIDSQPSNSHSLAERLTQVQDSIRRDPTNGSHRVHLFQLQIVVGLWNKALMQLQAAARFDVKANAMAQAYREVIRCEVYRSQVFSGLRQPNFLGEQHKWMLDMLKALVAEAAGSNAEAQELRVRSLNNAPAHTASIDGVQVEWMADADSRLGPICEALINGQYCWLAFCDISVLTIEKPQDLRDLVWSPMSVQLRDGATYSGFIPCRYPGTELNESDDLRLSRLTTWTDQGDDVWFGLGQRILVSDVGEHPLLDIRKIEFASNAL
jgi:type VI secretion system protein ImpE